VPLNGKENYFMMLPSNIYLSLKTMFYNLTGRGGQGGYREKSRSLKRRKKTARRVS